MGKYQQAGKLVGDPKLLRRVEVITERLVAQAVTMRPDSARWDWSVAIIDDPKTVNAWCMAGALASKMMPYYQAPGARPTAPGARRRRRRLMMEKPTPPVAAMKPHEVQSPHGDARRRVLLAARRRARGRRRCSRYLAAENAYKDAMLAHAARRSRRSSTPRSSGASSRTTPRCPYRDRGYWYYRRYEAGEEYPVYARRAGSLEAPEQVLLDLDELARGPRLLRRRPSSR